LTGAYSAVAPIFCAVRGVVGEACCPVKYYSLQSVERS
jgi:hypothetical protein